MIALLLLLGGTGSRFGSQLPKQFVQYQGKAVFSVTTSALLSSLPLTHVIFAVAPEYLLTEDFQAPFAQLQTSYPNVQFQAVPGGSTRHLSFRAAFAALQGRYPQVEKVLVHDANRPFLSNEFLARVGEQLQQLSGDVPCLIPGLTVTDSICRTLRGKVVRYENRDALFRVQTPQLLFVSATAQALQSEAAQLNNWTDEGSFMLAAGHSVVIFEGDVNNVKITYQQDLPNNPEEKP